VAVAALVLGIIGTVLALIPGVGWYAGIALGLIAIILGVLGRKAAAAENRPTGSATAGMVLGVVALVLSIAMWVLCSIMVSKATKGFEKALNDPELQKKLGDSKVNKEFDDAFKKAMEDAAKNK